MNRVVSRGSAPPLLVASAAAVALSVAAWLMDIELPGATTAFVVGDVTAGLAFVGAGLLLRGALTQRLLVMLVGIVWLAGSVWAWAEGLHQGTLVIALAAHPTGHPRDRTGARLLVGAIVVGVAISVAVPGPLVVAVVLGIEAIGLWWVDLGAVVARRTYASVACLVLAATLGHAFWLSQSGLAVEPALYQGAMVVVAAGWVVASVMEGRGDDGLGARVLGEKGNQDVTGLGVVLAQMLRDPSLRIVAGEVTPAAGRGVELDGEVVATVLSASATLTDERIAGAIDEAVRLMVRHQRLRSADEARVRDLHAAGLRLIGAVDRERQSVQAGLADRVLEPLDTAMVALGTLTSNPNPHAGGLLATVGDSLALARAEIEGIVRGVAPFDLGHGRLAEALPRLFVDSPIPVIIDVAGHPRAAGTTEIALFYICREAVANAVKHAGATHIQVRLADTAPGVVLQVRDDGRGGADPDGSGLVGIADRAVALGATLHVESTQRGGTVLTVRIGV